MALASKYQDKYIQAHEALIGVNSKLTEPRLHELLAGAGIDVDRATRDLAANAKAIDAILARNSDQATAFGFKGTPSFIVGKFRVPGVAHHGGVRSGHCRCAKGGGEQEIASALTAKTPPPKARAPMLVSNRHAIISTTA